MIWIADTQRKRSLWAMLVVVGVALGLRWPACGESFWLDELHTAWCLFGSFEQVAQRAEIGNQQCGYFAALYAWYQILPARLIALYGIEPMLRLPSVLLTSISAAWLVPIVTRASGSLTAGLIAGLTLSLDSSAIFFGTELRPYAAIIFFTTAALSVIARSSTPHDGAPDAGRLSSHQLIAVHVIVLLAAATQVTSLIVLAPLLVVFSISHLADCRHHPDPFKRAIKFHAIAGLLWIIIAAWWWSAHVSLWQARAAWSSFATPRSWADLWQMWPWTPLVIVPCIAASLQLLWLRQRRSGVQPDAPSELLWLLLRLLFVVVFATAASYLLSAFAGVSVWHRRYLVAALPLLCAITGLAIGSLKSKWIQVALSLPCLLLLSSQQGTLEGLRRGDFRVVQRGENWRSAIALLNRTLQPGDRVWIDAGLIEQNDQPTRVSDPWLEEYLRYVTAGPYQLEPHIQPIGVGSAAIESWQALDSADRSASDAPPDQPAALLTRRLDGVKILVRPAAKNPRQAP